MMNSKLQQKEYHRNIKIQLGIPDEYYDLELIFPTIHDDSSSEDRRLHPKVGSRVSFSRCDN
jgi:hypothetical protein